VIRFQRAAQTVTLTLFLGLLFLAGYPYEPRMEADFFLRLDPLIGVGTILAARDFMAAVLPGLILLLLTLVVGRIFCGHICPMGATVDILRAAVRAGKKTNARNNSTEATAQYRVWKYIGLVFIVAAAVGGISIVYVGSPLSLVTRFYGLSVYPVLLLVADSALYWIAPLLSKTGHPELMYLEITPRIFATNVFVFGVFVGIAALAYAQPRFWCRHLCPAGALMALFSRAPLVGRRVNESCTECGLCVGQCPAGAISSEDPGRTAHSECIVCLRCVEICHESAVSFSVGARAGAGVTAGVDFTRRKLVLAAGSGLITAGLFRVGVHQPRDVAGRRGLTDATLIRPPGALPEPEFLAGCVRCGECMVACPTNGLQPVWLKAGLEGLFGPVLVSRIGACALNCRACGQVCPTGAVRDLPLHEKQHAKIGTAWIVRQNCLAWEQDRKCLVCDEVCPYNALAFRPAKGLRNLVPFVIENRCTGCGWCENKCPVKGASAIRINVIGEVRIAEGSYVEKAREFGLVFRAKDHSRDRLRPESGEPGKSPTDRDGSLKPAPLIREAAPGQIGTDK